ncbi:putative NUP-1 protein [Trypanosoma grayi]|uniref:putative NUP-1 protein n=1 Tax=Trypanosoma grayi TaxID=71804 RepID=UPI0004F4862C|nr:putative NUP-1 protein [Trypanosoma grayi]KEG11215.1 putative NUP-1 protein [Trypanosoma grayi]
MLARRHIRQLEARQEELQLVLEKTEWELASLPASAEESIVELRWVRAQHKDLQVEHRRLQEKFDALKNQRAEELEEMRQQNERLMQQLRERRDKLASVSRQMRESELAAKEQAEELSQAFNLLDTQMRALRAEVGAPQGSRASPRRHSTKEPEDAQGKLLQGRITFLEHTLKQKEAEIHHLQQELERKEEQLDNLEEQVGSATRNVESTTRRSALLEKTLEQLRRTNDDLQDELRVVKGRVLAQAERLSSQPQPSRDTSRLPSRRLQSTSATATITRTKEVSHAASTRSHSRERQSIQEDEHQTPQRRTPRATSDRKRSRSGTHN